MTRVGALTLALLAMAALDPPAGAAQTDPDPLPAGTGWTARAAYEQTGILGAGQSWHAAEIHAGYRFRGGSVELSLDRNDRVVATDLGVGLSGYVPLWRHAYARLETRAAPGAEVTPRLRAAAEIYQAVGAWEVSASARSDRFPEASVRILGASTAHFAGPWSVRGRLTHALLGPEGASFGAVMVRRQLAETYDTFVQLTAGAGSEVVEIVADAAADGVRPEIRGAATATVFARLPLLRGVGLEVAAGHTRYDGLDDRLFGRLGFFSRW